MKTSIARIVPAILAGAVIGCAQKAAAQGTSAIPLHGEWRFQLDPDKIGIEKAWFSTNLTGKCRLPGSTDENKHGTPNTRKGDFAHLSRLYEYTGPAWYQRDVEIPAAWSGKRITLLLERCHWETQVWVDGKAFGMRDSLCVPHVYDLSRSLAPGRHRLTIRVDNTIKYDVGNWAHSITEETQTNWNGIIGRIELAASDPVWIDDVQVYPDAAAKIAKLRLTIGNATGKPAAGRLTIGARSRDAKHTVPVKEVALEATAATNAVSADLPMGDDIRLWDEFSPALYELTATLDATTDTGPCKNTRTAVFGMRDLRIADGKQFTVNGRRIYLRGTLECCIFPLTGYPPTDIEAWLRIFGICKSYGLNHMRFHSWCPPEAAFDAADQAGVLLHVESPLWAHDIGKNKPRDQFIAEEIKRILDTYGNHPSFGMFCVGNELNGDDKVLQDYVQLGKEHDPRHFYTSSTAWSHQPNNEYNVSVVRGLHGPATEFDFREQVAKCSVPVISHEIGQWTVYPDLEEMKKYTGALRPRNFEIIRDDLAAKHLLDQAPAFTRSTGQFSWRLYKEEIEVLLRTPGHAGFQLLDLHDFPGQGTSIIGILDPFWDSKGLISPEQYRRFCGSTVPLLRIPKRTYTIDEPFVAQAEISHFGPAAIENATPQWQIRNAAGRTLAAGDFATRTLPTGALTPLGKIEASLAKATAPEKLTITVSIKGTDAANDWDIWVYPASVDTGTPNVVISRMMDEPTLGALADGRRILLLAPAEILRKSLRGSFTPVFWGPILFPNQTGTMSILCDPKHPAMAEFATDAHSDWQWHDLLENSRTVVLDETPADYRPIVQVIDNFSRNHKLGNIFEAKVSKGRLLVCTIDLKKDMERRPAARQLLRSLLAYMDSRAFRPTHEFSRDMLLKLFREPADVAKFSREPAAPEKAVLRVKAAAKLPAPDKPDNWKPDADEVLAKREGFDYTVQGQTWRDSVGAAWHSQGDLKVRITCPKGFVGELYAHFHDWNNLQRAADVFFEGLAFAELDDYAETGKWVCVPITAKDTEDGVIELSARPTRANVMITQINVMGR